MLSSRVLILAAVLLVVPLSAHASSAPAPQTRSAIVPLDEAGFTAYALHKIAILQPTLRATSDQPLTLEIPGMGSIGLNRVYDFCERVPDECEFELTDFLSKVTRMKAGEPFDATMLRAALRPADYVTGLQAELSRFKPVELLVRPFAGELMEICLIDRPDTATPVQRPDYEKLGLTRDAAFQRCEDNIAASVPLDAVPDLPPGKIAVLAGEYYEASLVLLHAAWQPIAKLYDGKLLVSVPQPQVVLYAHGDEPALIDQMVLVAKKGAQTADRPISTQVFEWTPEGWKRVSP